MLLPGIYSTTVMLSYFSTLWKKKMIQQFKNYRTNLDENLMSEHLFAKRAKYGKNAGKKKESVVLSIEKSPTKKDKVKFVSLFSFSVKSIAVLVIMTAHCAIIVLFCVPVIMHVTHRSMSKSLIVRYSLQVSLICSSSACDLC